MKKLKGLVLALDRWQRRNRIAGVTYAVIKKFSDDQANLLVVALGWYGFTAIFPLLLVVVTTLGFIGASGLGDGILHTLHQFPVVGRDFTPGKGGSHLHGSLPGLIIGVAGLLYGAQGVTQTAQTAMGQVWNVPRVRLPGFVSRLARSLLGLAIIGGAFIVDAAVGSIASKQGLLLIGRVAIIGLLLVLNVGFYLAAFLTLTPPKTASARQLLPGAVVGAVGFTFLTTVGTGLVQHQLRHTGDTYGAFGSIIGIVAYLLLLAKLTVYGAELNPVLARHLWPRALPMAEPTEADNEVLAHLAHQEQVRPDERIGVGFGHEPPANRGHEEGDDPRGSHDDRASDSLDAERAWASNRQNQRTDWSIPSLPQSSGKGR